MATENPGLGSIPSGLASSGGETSNLSLGIDTSGIEAAEPALENFVFKTDEAAKAADRLTEATVAQSRFMRESGGISGAMAPIITKYAEDLKVASDETDNFRGLTARAKTEIVVLLHELSQDRLRQFGGSMLVMAELTGFASLAFTGLGAVITAALGPLAFYTAGLVAGAVAQKHFNDTLLLTNNAAGQTNDTMRELQLQLVQTTGVTLTTGRGILDNLIATGRVTQEMIAPLSEIIARVSRISRESTEEIQKDFIKIADAPTQWALESDKAYHAVNVLIFEHIKYLEEHGHKSEAALLAAKALSDHFRNEQAPAVGFLTDRMNYLKREFSDIYDYMQRIGADRTFAERIEEAEVKLQKLQKLRESSDKFNTSIPGSSGALNQQQQELTLQEQTALFYAQAGEKRRAFYAAESAQTQLEGKEAVERLRALDDRIKGSDRLSRALEKLKTDEAAELKAHQDAGDKGFEIDKKVHDARVAQLERDNVPQRVRGQITDEDIAKIDVDKIKQQFKTVGDAYKDIGIVMAAQNQAGIVDAQLRFDRIKAIDEAEANNAVASLERQNARLEQFNSTHRGSLIDQKAVGDNEKQITKNDEEIIRVRERLAAQLAATDIQSKAYFDHLNAEYLSATQKAQEFLRVSENQHRINLENQALSTREVVGKTGEDQINERARAAAQAEEDRRKVLEAAGQFTDTEQREYYRRLTIIRDFQAASLAEWKTYFKNLVAAEQDWTNGAKRALQNYIDNAGFTAKNTEGLFTKSFASAEDALVAFTTGAKVNFKSMVVSFIADLNRLAIQEQLLAPLAKYLKTLSFFGGGSGAESNPFDNIDFTSLTGIISSGAAVGGSFGRGSIAQVNEHGPELLTFNDKSVLMMGDNVGRVSPAGSYGGDTNIVFNIASGVSRNELAALVPAMTEHIKTQVIAQQRRPGSGG